MSSSIAEPAEEFIEIEAIEVKPAPMSACSARGGEHGPAAGRLLETSWEALEQAGIAAEKLSGSSIPACSSG